MIQRHPERKHSTVDNVGLDTSTFHCTTKTSSSYSCTF